MVLLELDHKNIHSIARTYYNGYIAIFRANRRSTGRRPFLCVYR